MTNPADSSVQNLLPVQAYFNTDGSFNTFIGQGQPFYATANPSQSGLSITNSTINSSVIGGVTPAVGYFTSGYVSVSPTTATGIANKQYVDYFAAGLSWKQPVKAASLANIASLSGFQTVDAVPLTDGDRVLVKDQSLSKNNGIYVVRTGAWEYAIGADDWAEYVGAIVFVEEGSQAYSAWYSLAQEGGTLGVTALDFANFSVSSTYSAGTGLSLNAGVFSITNTGVTNATYGSASKTVTLAINAQGQATSASQQDIAIAATQITSGTLDSARISGAYSGITGVGTLGDLTVTNAIVGSITGNAATATTAGSATTATTATNIAGGASGSIPYQTASSATSLLAKGTDGQILALASGLPSWINNTVGTVTSVAGTGTVSGISLSGTVTSSGSLTLGGSLDLSAPPVIGGTTPNTITGTTITANTQFVSENYYAQSILGGNLRTYTGTSLLNWDGGGSGNITFNGGISASPANKNIVLSPSGTGTVTISPAGALTVNPTTASTMNNVAIGGTTALAGTFTDLRVNGTISLAGSTGTSGYVLTSAGASAPTWSALPASGITITDDTTTNATRYLAFTSATSGSITGQNVSSTKLQYNPSTGVLTSTGFSGSGASLTALSASNVSAGVLGTSYGGTGLSSGFVNGIPWQSIQTGNFNATAGNAYPVNTTGGAITVTLPSSPSAGNVVVLVDYAGTWATNNVTLNVNGSNLNGAAANAILKIAREGISLVYIDSTQGWIAYSGFQDAIPSQPYTVSYLIVGGGAGGGGDTNTTGGGGGGAGGLLASTTSLTPGTAYTVTVGAGGGGGSGGNGTAGSNSSITGLTAAVGGGYGAGSNPQVGGGGGSGGGGKQGNNGGSGTSGQGSAGGSGTTYGAGGGGGASAVGANGGFSTGGNGGAGTASSITGSSVTYAGGGGGGSGNSGFGGSTPGSGGAGGGGAGGGTLANGNAGTANTGGGGGGSGQSGSTGSGAAGGSGVVILSIPTAKYSGTTTGSPSVTTSGSNTILTYNSSGSYTA